MSVPLAEGSPKQSSPKKSKHAALQGNKASLWLLAILLLEEAISAALKEGKRPEL